MAKKQTKLVRLREDGFGFRKMMEFKKRNKLKSVDEALNKMTLILDGLDNKKRRRARIIQNIEF